MRILQFGFAGDTLRLSSSEGQQQVGWRCRCGWKGYQGEIPRAVVRCLEDSIERGDCRTFRATMEDWGNDEEVVRMHSDPGSFLGRRIAAAIEADEALMRVEKELGGGGPQAGPPVQPEAHQARPRQAQTVLRIGTGQAGRAPSRMDWPRNCDMDSARGRQILMESAAK